jgi:hypothetical protein
MSPDVGRLVFIVGLVIAGVGLLAMLGVRLGRLPGDIVLGGERFTIYIPIVTSILISIALTVLLNLWSRR